MKKKNCYLFVFDGFSDWEASYATVGIAKSERFQLRTLALEKKPRKTMGGLSVNPEFDFIPEVDLDDIHDSNTGLLILPGGDAWLENKNDKIAPLVMHCMENQIPVAAICGATVFLSKLGLLDNVPHTSNQLSYLKAFSPSYGGEPHYRDWPAARGGNVITANGVAPVEFAREIFDILDIGSEERVRSWFRYFEKLTV